MMTNMQKHIRLPRAASSGFTLIEVLVAVVVLALGILGVAALQTVSINQGQGSLTGIQANALATDLADRIRANSAGAYAGYYSLDTTAASGSASNAPTSQPSTKCNFNSGSITACTTQALANQDLYNWYTLVAEQLPHPTVKVFCDVTCVNANPQTLTIIIYWNENRNNQSSTTLLDQNCGTTNYDATKDLPCIILALQP